MKAKKVLKRIAKIEALISEVTEQSSQSALNVRELLRDAKAAVIQAKEAVQASSGTATNPPSKGAKPSAKATPEPSRPKRRLSAAGRKAISEATKKRWAAARAAKKTAQAVTKKATVKTVAAKKATPVKVAKAPAHKVAKKAPAKRTAVKESAPVKAAKPPARNVAKKAPAKKAVRVVQVAKAPAPPSIEDSTVTTPEQAVPDAPVQ
jgi:hypothetical protein